MTWVDIERHWPQYCLWWKLQSSEWQWQSKENYQVNGIGNNSDNGNSDSLTFDHYWPSDSVDTLWLGQRVTVDGIKKSLSTIMKIRLHSCRPCLVTHQGALLIAIWALVRWSQGVFNHLVWSRPFKRTPAGVTVFMWTQIPHCDYVFWNISIKMDSKNHVQDNCGTRRIMIKTTTRFSKNDKDIFVFQLLRHPHSLEIIFTK